MLAHIEIPGILVSVWLKGRKSDSHSGAGVWTEDYIMNAGVYCEDLLFCFNNLIFFFLTDLNCQAII